MMRTIKDSKQSTASYNRCPCIGSPTSSGGNFDILVVTLIAIAVPEEMKLMVKYKKKKLYALFLI